MTALFADIKGSMDLIEDLDPEEARRIIDRALKLMIDAVHHYDGYVVQSTGDGIFAPFGAPVAHEDHPQRALHAALRMRDEMGRYSGRLRETGNSPLEVRVGINTGETVVRSIRTGDAHTEYTPIGHSTSLASRMQALAPTGSIAVTETTEKLCAGYFSFKALGPTRVKGVSEPVAVFEVVGLGPLRTRLQRSAGRGLTKFVGREREMETLKHAADRAISGHGQIVAAMAEAGTGKSRLYFEFKATAQAGWMVLETFSASHGEASAYLPVLDLLHGYFKIAGEDDQRTRREKLTGRILALDRAMEDTLPYLFGLLGIVDGQDPLAQMDGQVKKRRTLEAIKRILLRESLKQPLMVIFEDLHWIDEATQEFLNLLADSLGTAKILLLVNYRPEYSHKWNSKTYYTQLRLDPLGKQSAEEMLSALLGDSTALLPIKRVIIERTEGTPFFMEEMVQVLFEEGVLQRNGEVKLAKPLNAVKVPTTVQAMLAARIDRLPAEAKELLQTLAVIGREFSFSLIRAVVTQSESELDRLLNGLQLGEFIYEQPAVGGTEYIFKHALTREVAYNSLLLDRRKQLHERAGETLEAMFAGQLEDHLDELAHHYSRSDKIEKAVEYLRRVAEQALQRSAHADAIDRLTTATNLLQRLPDNPARIQRELILRLALGRAFSAVKGYAALEVERAYTRAWELCEPLGDTPELFPAVYGLWVMHLVRGELRRSRELAEQLLGRARIADDSDLLLYGLMASGVIAYWMGEFIPGKKYFEDAISIYDPDRHGPLVLRYGGIDLGMVCLTHDAWMLWQLGYPDRALKRGNEALALGRKLTHPLSNAQCDFFVGILRQYRREAGAVQEIAERVIAQSAEHGFIEFMADATPLRGWSIAQQGRRDEGLAQIREGLVTTRAIGAELWRPYFLCLQAETLLQTGRLDDGLATVAEALVTAEKHENHHNRAEIHRLKGELLLMLDDSNVQEVEICFRKAIEIARNQSAKSWELRATMSLARLLAKRGKRDEGRAMLAEIYNWFTEGFDTADLIEAKTLLDDLGH